MRHLLKVASTPKKVTALVVSIVVFVFFVWLYRGTMNGIFPYLNALVMTALPTVWIYASQYLMLKAIREENRDRYRTWTVMMFLGPVVTVLIYSDLNEASLAALGVHRLVSVLGRIVVTLIPLVTLPLLWITRNTRTNTARGREVG